MAKKYVVDLNEGEKADLVALIQKGRSVIVANEISAWESERNRWLGNHRLAFHDPQCQG